MALLNIKRKTEPEKPVEKVPDELPALPETAPSTSVPSAKQDAPAELPDLDVKAEPKSTPQSVSPPKQAAMEIKEDTFIFEDLEKKEEKQRPAEIPKPIDMPKPIPDYPATKVVLPISDDHLFFSQILKQLDIQGPDNLESTFLSENIVQEMRKHFKEERVQAEIDALNAEIKEKVVPLRSLEIEWQRLNKDISQKRSMLKNLERSIEGKTEELKSLILKYSKIKNPDHRE